MSVRGLCLKFSCRKILTWLCLPAFKQDVKSNKTVLHYTVQDGNVSLLRYFLELNAFKSKDFINSKVSADRGGAESPGVLQKALTPLPDTFFEQQRGTQWDLVQGLG